MSKLEIAVFNVELGQCIFVHPIDNKEYSMLIDCGNTSNFEPIDWLIQQNVIPTNTMGHFEIGDLVITNYDQDHFSGLPNLLKKAHIRSATLPKNIEAHEIEAIKETITEPIEKICHLRRTYTEDITNHNPPYIKAAYHLHREDFDSGEIEKIGTNNLSQIIFIEYNNTILCVCGDLEKRAWEIFLKRPHIQEWLSKTHIFVASHHGRDNGYHPDIFTHCNPETIIISDKYIIHGTQEDMSQTYRNHVSGDGINLNGNGTLRKVLTTRSDGHLLIVVDENGNRTYQTLSI